MSLSIIALFILGFVLLVKGADWLVDGASAVARHFGISDLVIGMTLVAFGTSMPELVVNVVASYKGASDIAIGNIIGSNIANILLILGVAAVIVPLAIKKSTLWIEIPLTGMSALLLLLLVNQFIADENTVQVLGRLEGFVLIICFLLFLVYTALLNRHQKNDRPAGPKKMEMGKAAIFVVLGLVAVFFGGKWVVEGAVMIARQMGVSDALIAITVVALGTALPELATATVAAVKKNTDIAVGNIMGSNIFNIFWVMGLSALIRPLPFGSNLNLDLGVNVLATTLLFGLVVLNKEHKLTRLAGLVLLAAYVGYLAFLIHRG